MHKLLVLVVGLLITIVSSDSITWYPCPLYTTNPRGKITMVQCATVEVPLDYDNKNRTTTIPLFIKRIAKSTPQKPAPKALWMLQGGPGMPSDFMESFMSEISSSTTDYDLYTTDHRGVGRSSKLTCLAPQAETEGSEDGVRISQQEMIHCADELKQSGKYSYYSAVAAGKDLIALLRAVKSAYPDQEQYIYGHSYGSMWITRAIQSVDSVTEVDSLISGIIMDGVVSTAAPLTQPTLRYTFDYIDVFTDDVGKALLQRCASDGLCYSKIQEADMLAYIRRVYENIAVKKTCSAVTTDMKKLKSMFGFMVGATEMREIIPALLYRFNRCDVNKDLPVLKHLLKTMDDLMNYTPNCPKLGSDLTMLNILYNEMWSVPDHSVEYWERLYNGTDMAVGAGQTLQQWKIDTKWPNYTTDSRYFNKAFSTTRPVLLLNGDMDNNTPLQFAQQQYQNIDSPNKKLIVFHNSVHNTLMSTPVNNSQVMCGMQVLLSFLQDPNNVNDGCLKNLVPISFKGQKFTNNWLLKVDDIWEGSLDVPTVSPAPTSSPTPSPSATPDNIVISLGVFLGVEIGTVVISCIVIGALVVWNIHLRKQQTHVILED